MKVLLLMPPYPKGKIFRKSMKHLGAVLPPLGITYIAAVLEKHGHEVNIIDGPALSTVEDYNFSNLSSDLKKINPDVIGVSASTSQYSDVHKTMGLIKEILPNTKIILGGPIITGDPNQLLNFPEVECAVHGEAEFVFNDIVNSLEKTGKVQIIDGVIFNKNGSVKVTKPPIVENIDDIPMPARHLLKMNLYKPSPANYRRLPATTMITSRGCPYQCIFCATGHSEFRPHSSKRVIEEIEVLINDFGIKDIQIFDDTFTLLPKRTEEICNGIIEKKLNISWNCYTRVDRISLDLLKLMKKAGCYETGFGIESGSKRILDFIKKGITIEQIKNGVKWAKEAKIDVRGFFTMGYPTETQEEIVQTINFAKELDVDIAQFMIATPLPGTELWEIANKMGTINEEDWSSFTFYAPTNMPISTNSISEKELLDLYKKAYRSFYLRPSYIVNQITKIRSIEDIKRIYLAGKGIIGM